MQTDGLSTEISKALEDYSGLVNEEVKKAAREIAKEAVEELKSTSPVGKGSKKGHYKNGWRDKVVSETVNTINITIYNAKKPGLAHLLEYGHAKKKGGRVAARPHIAKVEQKAVENFEKKIKQGAE